MHFKDRIIIYFENNQIFFSLWFIIHTNMYRPQTTIFLLNPTNDICCT